MAAQLLLSKRESCAMKLEDSVRQLKRCLDGDKHSMRVLQQKCDKVDVDREELIAKHHQYAEKAGIKLDDAEMKAYITPRIDEAVDVVDEGIITMEDLRLEKEKEKENVGDASSKEMRKMEIMAAKLQLHGDLATLTRTFEEIDKRLIMENPSEGDVVSVEAILGEITKREEELIKSWKRMISLITDEKDLNDLIENQTDTKVKILRKCTQAKKYLAYHRKPDVVVPKIQARRGVNENAGVKLEKMKPPRFSGNSRNYARFKADFETIVMPSYNDQVHQVYVLKEMCLHGPAFELVKNLDTLKEIWKRLSEKYGDTLEIVDAVIKDLQNIVIPKFEQDRGVVELVDVLERGMQDLLAIGKGNEIANAYTVKLIEQKLPRRVMLKWLEEEEKSQNDNRFECLFEYLKQERRRTEKMIQQQSDKEKDQPSKAKYKRQTVNPIISKEVDIRVNNSCLLHQNSSHLTRKCKDFLSMTVPERGQLVKDLDACVLCLSVSHVGKPCPWRLKWDPCRVEGCKEYHSRLLHGYGKKEMLNHAQMSQHSSNEDVDESTLLLIQSVKSGDKQVLTFWDNGSSISLVARSYVRKNNLRGINVSYDLVTVGNVVKPQNTTLYEIDIEDREGVFHTIKAYEIEEICQEIETTNMEDIAKLFENVQVEDITRPRRKVDLLIGMNCAYLHPKCVEIKENLVLYESIFGSGKVIGGRHKMITGKDRVNGFVKVVAHARVQNVKVREKIAVDFFTSEAFGVNVPPKCNRCKSCKECKFEIQQLSVIEQKELETIRNNLKLDPIENRWETQYPYKCDPCILKDNREQVMSLLVKTENRLKKNKIAGQQYCEQFNNFIERGIFKEIDERELNTYEGPVSYISHHEVFKEESSSTPVRIVLNSSLKFKGVSLNDILMKGPNSLNDLFAVQLRFRTYPCALVGDIEKMYHSIRTTEKERHLRRVLWRDMKVDQPPKAYGTETVTFGDKPAAAISTVAIYQTAELFKHIDENAAEKIKQDMYVDDLATGDSTTVKVNKLKINIKEILEKGGFRMKGFVMSGDTARENLDLLGTGEVGRILGIGWDPARDEFAVKIRINISKKIKGARRGTDVEYNEIPLLRETKLTRRILLGVTNSCYDPLGLLSPLTVQLKIELRDLYNKDLNLTWDKDIPKEKKVVWTSLLQVLKGSENLRFRRCIRDINSHGDPELVVFNDGSPKAMCAAAYIRWKLGTGKFSSQLVASKTRVTPLCRMTIPRIEMQSAVLGVRLSKSIINSCGSKFSSVMYMSDSKCTIATLAKESTALKEFMGNRVAEIRGYTEMSQWYHVKSADNIADLCTRSRATIEDVGKDSLWQRGPKWLQLDKSRWPVSQDVSSAVIPSEELLKSGICNVAMKRIPILDVNRMTARTYTFLMRVTARVIDVFGKKSFKDNEVSPANLKKAEMYWLKESMVLTKIEMEKGKLNSLRPKVDENGIIVLSTRAFKGMMHNYNTDTFPILTAKDPLAYLWIKEIHNEDHSGITKTVAKSRRKYWVIRGRRVAQKVKSKCYQCRRLDKVLAAQQMAPLPNCRLAIAPVFNVTSMDLFGPILIKDTVKKRVRMKVWGFIATCAATRAMHLDLTESYSTDSILQTLRKFIALRGCPTEILSDQGAQLIAAGKDIAELTRNWDWSSVSNWAANKRIVWKIVPAEGQHQNGLSESLIKSVKRSIQHIIGENILTFSELQLAFYEITNIINSRPIGVVSGSDPDCPQAITPNDLILGRSCNEIPQGPFNTKVSITKRFQFVQELVDDWWKCWYNSVLPSLVPTYKWLQRHRNIKVGDICLIRYKSIRSSYKLGRVIEAQHGEDGLVRKIRLQYKLPGENVFRTVDRVIQGVAVIVPIEEQEDVVTTQ